MGFFNRKKEKIAKETEKRNFSTSLSSILKSNGTPINSETVLKIPSVRQATELITGTISQLPIYLYKEDSNGNITRVRDYRENLLNAEVNILENSSNWKSDVVKDVLFHGVSYSFLDKNLLNVNGIYKTNVSGTSVEIMIDDRGIPVDADFRFALNNKSITADLSDMLIVSYNSKDGILAGDGILKNGEKFLTAVFNELELHNNILRQGILPIGYLKTTGRLNREVAERLRASMQSIYGGAKNAGKTMILEEGLEYKSISQTPEQLLMMESKKFNVEEVERLFNLPSGYLSNSTNLTSESKLRFLQQTITPILVAFEDALNKNLLLETEKENGYFFRFDTAEVERGTFAEMVSSVSMAVKSGILTINEGRNILDKSDFVSEDFLNVSLGNVQIFADGKMIIPNMGTSINSDTKEYLKNDKGLQE